MISGLFMFSPLETSRFGWDLIAAVPGSLPPECRDSRGAPAHLALEGEL